LLRRAVGVLAIIVGLLILTQAIRLAWAPVFDPDKADLDRNGLIVWSLISACLRWSFSSSAGWAHAAETKQRGEQPAPD
jgi:hypothetical protein